MYQLSHQLPDEEKLNLRSQLERASTSIVLNIAEGSTGQTNLEQKRLLGLALRSYLGTIACLDLIEQLNYLQKEEIVALRSLGHQIFIKLLAFRKALR